MIIGTGTMCLYLDHTINYFYVQVIFFVRIMLNKQFQLRLKLVNILKVISLKCNDTNKAVSLPTIMMYK